MGAAAAGASHQPPPAPQLSPPQTAELLRKGKGKGKPIVKAPPPSEAAREKAASAAEARMFEGGGKGDGAEGPVVCSHLGATPVPPQSVRGWA